MNFKNCIIVFCLSTFSFVSAAEESSQTNSEISVNPVPADQLPPPAPLDPNGGISAYAAAGAWTDVVYNPNITVAGQWYYGPLMEAPAGTPTTSIVQNITVTVHQGPIDRQL